MYRQFFVVLILGFFLCFLYGIWNLFLEVEPNHCRMTYMFGEPQFWKIRLDAEQFYPDYGLYYYTENQYESKNFENNLHGAPVLFVPGNGGSYKQVRSFASVALRKGRDNDRGIHLDYFTIDYNEELTGLFGGYLKNQRAYLKHCIKRILQIYNRRSNVDKKIILIGHSMGGIVAQSTMSDLEIAQMINSIIFISSPLTRPVVALDEHMLMFYRETRLFLSQYRPLHYATNETNVCRPLFETKYEQIIPENSDEILANILLLSIGGGNRDLLVRAGLTDSFFNDVHAMTTAIPKVWLSCDHLSSVWCLQLVLVTNRFLFSITAVDSKRNVFFKNDRKLLLDSAHNYFVRNKNNAKSLDKISEDEIWLPEVKMIFQKDFQNGLRKAHNMMLPLDRYQKGKKLYVEVNNVEETNWIFGCSSIKMVTNKIACQKATTLSHYIKMMPATNNVMKSAAILDFSNLKKTYSDWTHILVRLPPTQKHVQINVDIHDPIDRSVHIIAPKWFVLNKKVIVNETMQGVLYYKLLVEKLEEPFWAMKLSIEPKACSRQAFRILTKICVPWARGHDRYKEITEKTVHEGVFVNVPVSSVLGYNTTKNPVSVELFLDPSCRYKISYQFSTADTLSRIVQQFYHWLPSHLLAILIIVLKNQLGYEKAENLSVIKPYRGFFQYSSFYLVTASRVLQKMLRSVTFLPSVDMNNYSLYVPVIIHSTAIVLSIIASLTLWMLIVLCGNLMNKLFLRLLKISSPTSSIMLTIMTSLPITFGVLAVAIAIRTCSGVALIITCVFYFILLSNEFKDFMEDWLWEKAFDFVKKLKRGKKLERNNTADTQQLLEQSDDESVTAEQQETEGAQNAEEKAQNNVGLQNFSFHITLFLLLLMLTIVNSTATLAWFKTHRVETSWSDPALPTTIVILICLSLLWQLKSPKIFGLKVIAFLLYLLALASILYCQEAIYRINYLIAVVYVLVFVQEILGVVVNFFV